MQTTDSLHALFPAEADIPAAFRLAAPVEQTEYLVGGELRHWDGPRQDVFSPVCVRTDSGLVQQRIGSYPLLTEKKPCKLSTPPRAPTTAGGAAGPRCRLPNALRTYRTSCSA